ncbi:hypothetical protein AKJ62_01580 [candidate division MSBL1 archaeon SCGC-AAA259D14]|uniref:RecF/RecN/SMC N-terminal domain-containing protein n=1 Tax=candidate division MSBL1 archaeon SCGC-AAA259D14 TaxID=1698261 RepID=A0A133U7J6_9EURY|nr:hypothetical protein AKJ62_01580 [candidate division MSBL1 archaeon SCGC-AAA259D14]
MDSEKIGKLSELLALTGVLKPDKQKVNSTKSGLQTEIEKDKEKIGQLDEIEGQIDQKNEKIGESQGSISEASDKIEELGGKIEEADCNPDIDQESELKEKRDEVIGSLQSLRDKRDELREELGISEDLSLEKVEEEVDEKEYEVKVYKYAENIVRKSKERIMGNILPKTEANMARFLPILTNGRYKDVRIDSDSFKIEAYDGRAQAYKSKSIFSGGTKDQFSLALRLSFAMATLPQERGTAPDFLYLDEPVGSFDPSRQKALTELLTRGEIAENFGQIFIVSHVQGLKEQFDNHIEMEDGQIAKIEMGS